jgi:hypothetical protein
MVWRSAESSFVRHCFEHWPNELRQQLVVEYRHSFVRCESAFEHPGGVRKGGMITCEERSEALSENRW